MLLQRGQFGFVFDLLQRILWLLALASCLGTLAAGRPLLSTESTIDSSALFYLDGAGSQGIFRGLLDHFPHGRKVVAEGPHRRFFRFAA